jgi:dipeptide/tripeptide permease
MFISLNYVFSLIGGILADEFLGRLLTLTICVWIMVVGVFICCGVSLLGVFVDSWANYLIFVGLTLFAIGNGALIPNVSAFLGDQFLPFEVICNKYNSNSENS